MSFKRMTIPLLLLPLAACGGAFSEKPPGPCPIVVAVNDASRITKFLGDGTDLTEVLYEARIEDVQYTCTYDGPAIEMDLTVTMVGTIGPANQNKSAQFDYFVAVASADREILAREDFDVTLPFEGNANRVRMIETVEPRIPLNPGETGADFRIFVGFDLTETELQYNRSRP